MIAAIEHTELPSVCKHLIKADVALLIVFFDILFPSALLFQFFTFLVCYGLLWVDELALITVHAFSHKEVLAYYRSLLLLQESFKQLLFVSLQLHDHLFVEVPVNNCILSKLGMLPFFVNANQDPLLPHLTILVVNKDVRVVVAVLPELASHHLNL